MFGVTGLLSGVGRAVGGTGVASGDWVFGACVFGVISSVPGCACVSGGIVVLGEACAPEGVAEAGGAACAKQALVNSTVKNPAQISFFIPFTSPR